MASDAQDSRRKHRRSSDYESDESSKRRKHRHHHRHHRRSGRKHEEDDKGKRDEAEHVSPPPSLPPPLTAQAPVVVAGPGSNWRPDYDMEEGEIVEDEDGGFGVGDDEMVKNKGDSDAESGEMNIVEIRDESGPQNLGGHTEGCASHHKVQEKLGQNEKISGKNGRKLKTLGEERKGDDMVTDLIIDRKDKKEYLRGKLETSNHEMLSSGSPGSPINGDIVHEFFKEDIRPQVTHSLSSRREDKYKTLRYSPPQDRYHERVHASGRSRSCDRVRERSRSQSIVQEVMAHNRERNATFYADNSNTDHDSDNERMVRHSRNHKHGGRDWARDEERERSTSYSRHDGREDRHCSWETLDRDRDEREVERARKRDRECDKSGDWEIERDIRREKDREQSRDRDRKREKERDRDRDRDRDRALKMDKEWDRERDWSRDMVRERDRLRERDRSWERAREREREKERVRARDRDRNRDKGRDTGRDSRYHKYEILDGYGDRDKYSSRSRHARHEEMNYYTDRTKKYESSKIDGAKREPYEGGEDKPKRDDDEQEDYEEKVALQLAEQEEEDLNRIKEESRRRRQAILEKYKAQVLQQQTEPHSVDAGKNKEPVEEPVRQSVASGNNVGSKILDGRSDGADVYVAEPSFSVGKSPLQNGVSSFERTSGAGGLGEGTPKSERSDDMFCDDIFGESPAGVRKSGKGDGLPVERSGLHDNWDDADGYYSYRFGEILDGRYEVTAAHGKGVFSTVVRAKDLKAGNGDPEEVAIKIIRNNDTMYKAGMQELVILKKLVGADPDDRRHCVRFLSHFKYRNHLCLVFESLHMNLREVLKKFGRNIGLKLTAVRAYAKQLFIALKHLRNCGVLHCDIKPDNMLVNEAKNVLKLCDFGNAMFAGKNEITPYLVSRFYRAPEIILGLPYDHPLDIWSVGCCLYELYTGKVLFPGPSNNDMLRLHMELKGPFPKKMIRKAGFTEQHFDQDLNFLSAEEDPVTKKTIKRLVLNIKPKDIGTIITSSPGEDPKMVANFKDLLDKIFVLDPEKRMTVSQALNHPFITGK